MDRIKKTGYEQIMHKLLNVISSKKHVVWDWNGTLLDDAHHAVNIMNHLLSEHQLPIINQKTYKELFGFPVKNYYEKLGFDFSKINFEQLSHKFVDHYMQGVSQCRPFLHSKKLLQEVKKQNKMQSILSASDQDSLNHVVSHFQLKDYFDHLFGIDNKLAGSKLNRGFDLLKEAGVPASETVLIGDTDHDLEVGKALGVEVVLLAHGHQSEERLRQVHHQVIKIEL